MRSNPFILVVFVGALLAQNVGAADADPCADKCARTKEMRDMACPRSKLEGGQCIAENAKNFDRCRKRCAPPEPAPAAAPAK